MEQEAGGRSQLEKMSADELENLWSRAKNSEVLKSEEKL
jgi:hypothetical protein